MADPAGRCSDCIFFDAVSDDERMLPVVPSRGGPIGEPLPPPREGLCRANPPQTYPAATQDGQRACLSVWARVHETEWCGVYEPIKEASEAIPREAIAYEVVVNDEVVHQAADIEEARQWVTAAGVADKALIFPVLAG